MNTLIKVIYQKGSGHYLWPRVCSGYWGKSETEKSPGRNKMRSEVRTGVRAQG